MNFDSIQVGALFMLPLTGAWDWTTYEVRCMLLFKKWCENSWSFFFNRQKIVYKLTNSKWLPDASNCQCSIIHKKLHLYLKFLCKASIVDMSLGHSKDQFTCVAFRIGFKNYWYQKALIIQIGDYQRKFQQFVIMVTGLHQIE